jgi:hypothetical protein
MGVRQELSGNENGTGLICGLLRQGTLPPSAHHAFSYTPTERERKTSIGASERLLPPVSPTLRAVRHALDARTV